jgi:hypothetical protein
MFKIEFCAGDVGQKIMSRQWFVKFSCMLRQVRSDLTFLSQLCHSLALQAMFAKSNDCAHSNYVRMRDLLAE